jgi:hypothetical protein
MCSKTKGEREQREDLAINDVCALRSFAVPLDSRPGIVKGRTMTKAVWVAYSRDSHMLSAWRQQRDQLFIDRA